jgi:hypothetical protein
MIVAGLAGLAILATPVAALDGPQERPRAFIDGSGPGWKSLGESDFVNVNCRGDTWSWKDGVAYCTGTPYGVIRSAQKYTNFELVLQWRLMQWAGDSGVFVWVTDEALQAPARREAKFPHAIEVQVMDHGFVEKYEKEYKKKADWFTTHGDVFPFGSARMKPFPPVSPNGTRSFPSKHLSKGFGEWNHYYIRCINGEVRVWVNGEEVSGGTNCYPRSGYIALESEGSPVEYKQMRIRELP